MIKEKTTTMHVYFLINKGVHLLDLAGPVQALHEASKRGADIELHYIGFEASTTSHQGLNFSNIEKPPKTLPDNAVVMITASHYDGDIYTDVASQRSIHWLQSTHRQDTSLIGICTGSLLLAKSKLLDGKQCTSHHSLQGVIETQYPKVTFVWNYIFFEDGNIITTAGVTAGLDVTLHLIEKQFGARMALAIARDLVVYRRRLPNDPQLSIHMQYREHIQPLVHKVQDYIQVNFQTQISQADLAQMNSVSIRHLQRAFKQATDTTIHRYINHYRTEHAKAMLSSTSPSTITRSKLKPSINLEYIAHASGFPNSDSLRKELKRLKE